MMSWRTLGSVVTGAFVGAAVALLLGWAIHSLLFVISGWLKIPAVGGYRTYGIPAYHVRGVWQGAVLGAAVALFPRRWHLVHLWLIVGVQLWAFYFHLLVRGRSMSLLWLQHQFHYLLWLGLTAVVTASLCLRLIHGIDWPVFERRAREARPAGRRRGRRTSSVSRRASPAGGRGG